MFGICMDIVQECGFCYEIFCFIFDFFNEIFNFDYFVIVKCVVYFNLDEEVFCMFQIFVDGGD